MHTEYHEEGHTHKNHIFLWIWKFSRYPRGFVSGSSYNEFENFMIIWLVRKDLIYSFLSW